MAVLLACCCWLLLRCVRTEEGKDSGRGLDPVNKMGRPVRGVSRQQSTRAQSRLATSRARGFKFSNLGGAATARDLLQAPSPPQAAAPPSLWSSAAR